MRLVAALVLALACLGIMGCTRNTASVSAVPQARDNDATENKEIARYLIRTEYSQWDDETQFQCLENLWHAESRWNHLAKNKRTGACGIPQSYPCNKMADWGRAYGVDYRRNPWPQVAWGLQYIAERYGSPCAAWRRFKRGGGY